MEGARWWYAIGRQRLGPVSGEELMALFKSEKINGDSLIWEAGMANWQKASTLPALKDYLKSSRRRQPRQKERAPAPVQNEREWGGACEYAGCWRRYFALCIDEFIIMAIGYIVVYPMLSSGYLTETSLEESVVVFPLFLLTVWLYNALMESSSLQATVGKLALGIKVTDMNGNRVSFLRATGRCFSKVFLSATFLSIGFLLALFTKQRQALHDLIAQTIVVRGR